MVQTLQISIQLSWNRFNCDGYFYKREYCYDEKLDVYIAPTDNYSATTLPTAKSPVGTTPTRNNAATARYKLHDKCTQSSNPTKVVAQHVWEANRERIAQHRFNRVGKRIYKRRKETVERSFAGAIQLHGHGYVRRRDLSQRAAAMPARRHRTEHQKNRSDP